MSITSNGNYIQSEATGTNADGQYLYLSGSRFVLSSTNRTYIGLVDVDWFVPCTSLTFKETYYSTYISGKTQALEIGGGTPAGANCLGNNYITYTISDTSVCTLNSSKQLVGASIGSATITATHKMTGATGTVQVHVGYPTKIKIYYDYAFENVCLDNAALYSDWEGPITQIEKWFDAVRKKYAEDLNIHLILVSTTLYRSYPETLTSDNRMICNDGDSYNSLCSCSSSCDNSSPNSLKGYHHKNMYNIACRMPRPDTTENLNILFTGHKVCDESDSGSCSTGPLGLTYGTLGICVISMNPNNGNGRTHGKIIKTIAHEIGHFFDVDDHYNTASTTDDDCIWGDDRNDTDIYSVLKMCDTCMATLNANKAIYNHR